MRNIENLSQTWQPNVGGDIKAGRRPEDWRVTLESDLADGWQVRGVCIYRDGRVRLREVTFTPPEDDDTIGGLKAALRRLRLSWVAREWERVLLRTRWAQLPPEWQAGIRESPRPGRAGHPPIFYAEWVDRYLTACEQKDPATATLIAEHPGESAQSISRYLVKAERLGLITDRPGRGRTGGTMTDKCRRILAGEED